MSARSMATPSPAAASTTRGPGTSASARPSSSRCSTVKYLGACQHPSAGSVSFHFPREMSSRELFRTSGVVQLPSEFRDSEEWRKCMLASLNKGFAVLATPPAASEPQLVRLKRRFPSIPAEYLALVAEATEI